MICSFRECPDSSESVRTLRRASGEKMDSFLGGSCGKSKTFLGFSFALPGLSYLCATCRTPGVRSRAFFPIEKGSKNSPRFALFWSVRTLRGASGELGVKMDCFLERSCEKSKTFYNFSLALPGLSYLCATCHTPGVRSRPCFHIEKGVQK